MNASNHSLAKYGVAALAGTLIYTALWFLWENTIKVNFPKIDISTWLTAGIPFFILITAFLWHIARAPYEIYLEMCAAYEAERKENTATVDKLKQELSNEQNTRIRDISSLNAAIDNLKKPRFEIRCEDGGISSTVNHEATITITYQSSLGSTKTRMEVISLFGFTIKNKGIDTAKNCRATLVRVEKDGLPVLTKTGGLGFEARNVGDDLESVDIPNDIEQAVCACSVTCNERVMIGVGNAKWRHGSTDQTFAQTGDYDIFIDISSDGVATQREHFIFTWLGKRSDSKFRHEPTSGIKT